MRMCWFTPKLGWGSSLKLDMEKLGLASQSSGAEDEPLEASLARFREDLESRVAVSVALSLSESFSELSFAFSGVLGFVAKKRIELVLRTGE